MTWWDAAALIACQLIALLAAWSPPEMTAPAGPTSLLVFSTVATIALAISNYREGRAFQKRMSEGKMGYEQLASTPEDLKKLANSLRGRIAEKGRQKESLEEQLAVIEKKIQETSEAK